MGSSQYSNEEIIFLDSIYRDSLTKGTVLAADDNGVFQHISPSANGQVLISNLSLANGVEFASFSSTGFGVPASSPINIPAVGSTVYFLNTGSTTEPKSIVLPAVEVVAFTITPYQVGGVNGWSTTPTNITGGTLDFYFCYIPFSTQNSTANVQYLSTLSLVPPVTPDYQILGTSINSVAENFQSFLNSGIGLSSASNDQLFIRLTNNLTTSGSPTFHAFQCLTIFKTS